MYNTNSNNYKRQEFAQQTADFPPGPYRKKAMTKVRQNSNGIGTNRGILIQNPNTFEERWVTIDSQDEVCKLPFGSTVYYTGHGNRPSLLTYDNAQQIEQTSVQQFAEPTQQNQFTQHFTNYAEGPVEQIKSAMSEASIDDQLLEQICLTLSNAINLCASLNPQLSEDNIVKLAISASIAYQKAREGLTF